MRVLVTGDEGFVGGYLTDLLKKQEHDVYGFDLKSGNDLRNYEDVHRVIDIVRPDKIFHIAALAYIPESFVDPRRAIDTNLTGSLNILEAVKNIGLKTKIHLCGTSEEYGDNRNAVEPITEQSSPTPLSPYAIAKLGMTNLGVLYAESYNMHIVVTRSFNHTGPGRGEMYAESAFAKQIAEIERGDRKILKHGNLESIRNYTDVRDIVRGYTEAIDLPPGIYNLCSDTNVPMVDVLDILTSYAKCDIPTEADQTLFRPADFSFKVPSPKKFNELTDWKPTITLEQTLRDILEYWRRKLI